MANKHLVEYDLGNGETILVEVESQPGDVKRISKDTNTEKAAGGFSQAIKGIRPAAQIMMDSLKGLKPEEIALEVGVKFTAKAGVVLVSADSEATFKVTLTWKPAKDEQSV